MTYIPKDDLDTRLLEHFAHRFPRPTTLDFCAYDVDREEVQLLCQYPHPFALVSQSITPLALLQPPLERDLLHTYIFNLRYEMFGNWKDFPAFAGMMCCYFRRESFLLDNLLSPFLLHLGYSGLFQKEDIPILREWTDDILMPWKRSISRESGFPDYSNVLSYLLIHAALDGNIENILSENIAYSKKTARPTAIITCLYYELDDHKQRFHLDGIESYVHKQDWTLPPRTNNHHDHAMRIAWCKRITATIQMYESQLLELIQKLY